jgi:predicted amidophosphoribosyltransferase
VITATELTDLLVLPPEPARDACPTCQSWRDPIYPLCSTCHVARESLGTLCGMSAISLCSRPSKLRDWLTYYKHATHEHYCESRAALVAICGSYLQARGEALWSKWGPWDVATVVPSTFGSARHPLNDVIDECGGDINAPVRTLLRRTSDPLGRRHYSTHAYAASAAAEGLRVLLVDDVYVTGTRAQSAAAALRAGGATPVRILVVGRRINPEFHPLASSLWQRQAEHAFRFSEVPLGG